MTVSPAILLWLVTAPALLGIAFLRAIGLRFTDDRLGYPAWAWLSGCLSLGASLFVYLLFHVPIWLWWTAPVFGGLLLLLLGTRRQRPVTPGTPARSHRLLLLLVAAGVLLVLLHALAGASRPCVEADEGTIWSLKAKSLFLEWAQPAEFAAAQRFNLHPDYPLLDPLLQTWVYSQHGAVVHFENRLLIQLCAVALWLASCAALRARVSGWLAGLLGCVLLFDDDFRALCRVAYADGMLALGLLVALDGWLRWRETEAAAWRWLGATGLAFALWSKNEACLYAVAAAVALLIALVRGGALAAMRRNARAVVCLMLPLAVVAVQRQFNLRFGLHNDLLGANPTGKSMFRLFGEQFATHAPMILERARSVLLSFELAPGAFALLLLLPLLLPGLAFSAELLAPTLWLLACVFGVHLVYVGTFLDLKLHLDTSYTRVLFQLLPATLLWFAVLARGILRPRPAAPPSPAVPS